MEYRKKTGAETVWHCCSNCKAWPAEDYTSSEALPAGGVLCRICRAKTQLGKCRETPPFAAVE